MTNKSQKKQIQSKMKCDWNLSPMLIQLDETLMEDMYDVPFRDGYGYGSGEMESDRIEYSLM